MASGTERLNHLMGRPLTTPVVVEPVAELGLTAAADTPPDVEARPDVRRARITVRLAELGERAAGIDRWPTVDLALQSITPMNIDGAPRNITSLALRATWQPFDWGRQAHERARLAIERRRAAAAAADVVSAATLEIHASERALAEAQVVLRAAAAARDAAEERARVATVRYRERAVLLVDALEAHDVLADRTARYDRALLAVLDARATLAFVLGEDLHP
jgi:outer membrane protein TolC